MKDYERALNAADFAVVFYSPDAVKIKQLEKVTSHQISEAFKSNDLIIYTNPEEFEGFLYEYYLKESSILLMSSGNYGGLDFDAVKDWIS